MKRSKPPNKSRPGGSRRVSVLRDPKYLEWLKETQGCSVGNQVHRIVSRGHCDPAHGPVNGMSSKGPDNGAIALCRIHHSEQHGMTWQQFEEKYGIDRFVIAAACYAKYAEYI